MILNVFLLFIIINICLFIELYHIPLLFAIEFAVFYKYLKNVKNLIIAIANFKKMYYNTMEWENIHKQIIF